MIKSCQQWHFVRSPTRHPDEDESAICAPKSQIVAMSADIPKSPREWSCPIPGCGLGLGHLPTMDRLRAIRKPIADAHPARCHPRWIADAARAGKSPALLIGAVKNSASFLLWYTEVMQDC